MNQREYQNDTENAGRDSHRDSLAGGHTGCLAVDEHDMRRRRIPIVICPNCNCTDEDVYFAPRQGFRKWHCPKCDQIVDLIKMLGISYAEQLPLNISKEAR